ncbi:hypothetical protein CHCC15325_3038 [Bacillus licheniformis]|nr:hypothetical protein CHCC15325_3038 [Bacillus licheniformis]
MIEDRLDKLYTYLENTFTHEERRAWKRVEEDLIFSLMKIKEIKNEIW